ncbi:MAG: flagellar basal-body MS-ring/collar protein FliF [Paracoccus sp. (in: a-proteobacteria)]
MQELQKFWAARTPLQRLTILGGFVTSFILVMAFIALAGRVPMALLYSGLDDAQSAPVVAHLEQSGISYELRSGSIWVDESQRDRIRMDLAARNLPQQGGAGYEILDEMSGFSTTSQMFNAAYWRAKEGELARTILSIPSVRSARVHLTAPQARGYRNTQAGAASVTVVTGTTPLTRAQADSMRFLISSAVPGLSPNTVSVIDSMRGIVQPSDDQTSTDRETHMKENVERILAPHVGAGNAIVELSLDLVTETEQLTERRFDPTQRAMISEETEELTDESSMADNAAVTAASNLPDGNQQAGDRQQSQRAETRQRANYEVGSIMRQIERRPGAIRRLSVAVLVNGTTQTGADGNPEIVARSASDLAEIRDLVAAAVGYDEARGDEITVKSMPFVTTAETGTQVGKSDSLLDQLALNSLVRLALIGIFATIALGLTMRGLRSRSSPGKAGARLDDTALPASAPGEHPTGNLETSITPTPPTTAAEYEIDMPDQITADPVSRLKQLMHERQDETARLLNGWIGEDKRTTT